MPTSVPTQSSGSLVGSASEEDSESLHGGMGDVPPVQSEAGAGAWCPLNPSVITKSCLAH